MSMGKGSMGKGRLERYQRLRDVCKRIVGNPHNIDDDVKTRLKTAVLKYASTLHDDPTQALEVLYHDRDGLGDLVRKAVEVVADHDAPDDPIRAPVSDHPVSRLADLLVEAGSHPDRAAALQHLLHKPAGQALLARMNKKDEPTMTSTHADFVRDVVKTYGIVALAKSMVKDEKSYGLDENEFTALATEHAQRLYPNDRPDTAFSKLYETEESVHRACQLAKAAEFSVFDIKPVVVGTPDAMHEANDDTEQSAALRAYEEILRIGREKFPFLPADQQFARVFEDKNYAALAAQAHRRPGPTTIYAMPGSAAPGRGAYTKSDPAPNADSAYGELMLKAQAYRDAHPELTEAQCFERVYTDRANRELAKRERIESAPR